MKLSCSRELLLNYINIVLKAVSSRTTLPILEYILLKTEDSGFTMTATDLELGIKTSPIEAEIEEHGAIALEARIFSEIIRKTNGETIYISTDDNLNTTISCGKSKFEISGQPGEEFPALPEIEKQNEIKLLQNDFKNMIRQTIFSIAQEDSKPILTGELIEIEKELIHIVSVDGYRISLRKASLIQSSQNVSVIVPGKTLNEISKILMSEQEQMSIYITEKHILFDLGTSIVISRLIEGDFIRYEQSFTQDCQTKIVVNRQNLISSLERASLVSRDSKKTPVKIEINEQSITITSKAEMGTSHEELEIEIDGQELEIAFNPKYLIDALKVIEDERIKIQFTTYLAPCIIRPLEGEEYQYLILPLRL